MKQVPALLLGFSLGLTPVTPSAFAKPDMGQIAIAVSRLLEESHYSRQKLDDTMSERLLTLYIDNIDYNRLFFLQSDIDRFFSQHKTTLEDDILLGNLNAAYAIYDTYLLRLEQSVNKVRALLDDPDLIDPKATVEIRRSKAPWPVDEADQAKLWRNQVAAALLQERLNKHATEKPADVVLRRYERLLRNAKANTRDEQARLLINTLAQVYDPHSEYNDNSQYKSFQIDIGLRLVGIGAMLRPDDGYTRVVELVPGGPAAMDGRLKIKDRIVAVAQGDEPFVDVVDMDLDKVVEMIRGKKGSTVRLQIIPGTAADPSSRSVIQLVRDEISLKEKEAKAELIELPNGRGGTTRVGWITIPSFYFDVDRTRRPDAPSTSRHVEILLNRLKQEGVAGIVIDLSRNGGGALDEAVRLTGLFIDTGYVVQAKDQQGHIRESMDTDPRVVYDGPLVVLTSRASASASEIFAAALQDYGRAVIVGDKSTFGKGTVQAYVELGNWVPFLSTGDPEAGALRLTIQKFYRVSGGSTQFNGVLSDIILPSSSDFEEIGESALKYPLPYDEVAPLPHRKVTDLTPIIPALRARSAARVAANVEFRDIEQDLNRFTTRIKENTITLDESARRAEIDAEKARTKARKEARAKQNRPEPVSYYLTVGNAADPKLELTKAVLANRKSEALRHRAAPTTPPPAENSPAADEDEDEETLMRGERPEIDPIKDETLSILLDLISFQTEPHTVQTR